MWALFEQGELTANSKLNGVFAREETVADADGVVVAVDDGPMRVATSSSCRGRAMRTAMSASLRSRLPGWRREAFAVRTNSDVAQLALVRSGAGIGVCQTAIARRPGNRARSPQNRSAQQSALPHFGPYCISPLPNDQSSRPVSTRLIHTSSFRTSPFA
jgi:hypothetical protein